MARLLFLFCSIYLILFHFAPAQAKKLALVIGNNAYNNLGKNAQLERAHNDAVSVRDALRTLDFQVLEGFDLGHSEMIRKVNKLVELIEPGDEVVFFFAGHGVGIQGQNYLIPSDTPKFRKGEGELLKRGSLLVASIIQQFKDKGSRINLLILDACRNNPFQLEKRGRTLDSETEKTLGSVQGHVTMEPPPEGTMVIFSAGAGQVALDQLTFSDDTHKNSVFTRVLTPLLLEKGLEIKRLANIVREKVYNLAVKDSHIQVPASYNEIIRNYYLAGPHERTIDVVRQPEEQSRKGKKIGSVIKDCESCPELVVVPAGEFQMGAVLSEAGRGDDESTGHTVAIAKPFAVGKFEVTRFQYRTFLKETRYKPENKCWTYEDKTWRERADRSYLKPGFKQHKKHPAVCVSWEDANAYVKWLSRKTGRAYRLLSEAEWEYAVRAGQNRAFHFGRDVNRHCGHANGADLIAKQQFSHWKTSSCSDGYVHTAPSGTFNANAFGLYDMHGNAWEWVADCYHTDFASAPKNGSEYVSSKGCRNRIIRGGGWDSKPFLLRSAGRTRYGAKKRNSNIGFRVARPL